MTIPRPTNASEVPGVYANNVEISASAFDVRVFFNEVVVENGIASTYRRASVVMSIDHFVVMAMAFMANAGIVPVTAQKMQLQIRQQFQQQVQEIEKARKQTPEPNPTAGS